MLLSPAASQDARPTVVIPNGRSQLEARQGCEAPAGVLFLRRTNLHQQDAAWLEVVFRSGQEPIEDGKPIGAAVKGQVGLEVAHRDVECGEVGVRNVH